MEDQIRAEVVQEVATAMLKAAGDVMKVHGDDPHGIVIVAAALRLMVDTITQNMDPKFGRVVSELLDKYK